MNIIFYSDYNYEYQAKSLIESIIVNVKEDVQMIYYTIGFESSLDYPNLVKVPYPKDNSKLLNANGTFITPVGILEVLFTNITGPNITNNQAIKASIVHTTGIYEKATEVTIQELDDDTKTSIVAIVF